MHQLRRQELAPPNLSPYAKMDRQCALDLKVRSPAREDANTYSDVNLNVQRRPWAIKYCLLALSVPGQRGDTRFF